MVSVSRRALWAMRVSTISWSQSCRGPVSRLRRTILRVEKLGVELITTTNRARNAPKALCLVTDPGREQAPAESFNTLSTSTPSGEYLRRGCHPSRSVSARLVKK